MFLKNSFFSGTIIENLAIGLQTTPSFERIKEESVDVLYMEYKSI